MRALLRGSMGRSLRTLQAEDRLTAAWTVACGRALAERGTVMGYEDGVVRIEVADATWLRQMMGMRSQLASEMTRIAGVPVREIGFQLQGGRPAPTEGNVPWRRRRAGGVAR